MIIIESKSGEKKKKEKKKEKVRIVQKLIKRILNDPRGKRARERERERMLGKISKSEKRKRAIAYEGENGGKEGVCAPSVWLKEKQ